MKRLILSLALIPLSEFAWAISAEDFNNIPRSSYTEVASAGPVIFASGTIRFVGVTIGTTAPNSYVTFFRSTTNIFTTDLATQTVIPTSSQPPSPFVPLNLMENTSFTYVSKVGTAGVTFWFICKDNETSLRDANGFPPQGKCPGLSNGGGR